MNRIIKKYYKIINKNIKKKTKILVISDIHFSHIFKFKKLDKILDLIKIEKPDFICIPGDLIDNTNMYEKYDLRDQIKTSLERLAKEATVVLCLGNHDIAHLLKNGYHAKYENGINEDYYKDLDHIKNVIFLNDYSYKDQKTNINFIGINPSFCYYKIKDEDIDTLLEELDKVKINTSKKDCNVLLFHSPLRIMEDKVLEHRNIKNVDLILSGHMHNGLVPPLLDKIWKGNNGIVTASKKLFPNAKMARGRVDKNGKTLIISGGITKLSSTTPKLLHPFNELFPMNVDIITLDNN